MVVSFRFMRKNIFFTFIFIGIFNISLPILPAATEDINVNSSSDLGSEDNRENILNSKATNGYNYLIGSGDIIRLKWMDFSPHYWKFLYRE